MSLDTSNANSKSSSDQDDSTVVSPTQSRRFQPIVMPETDDPTAEASGTIRRKPSPVAEETYGRAALILPGIETAVC